VSAHDLARAVWKKSTRSGNGSDSNCIEVADLGTAVAVRDSKHPRPVLIFTPEEWRGFIGGVKEGEFDLTL
jgi:hypothetical protein